MSEHALAHQAASVEAVFDQRMQAFWAQATQAAYMPANAAPAALAVAFSGGLDSSVLLHLAARWASARAVPMHVWHVHHGLSTQADAWRAHCAAQAAALALPFVAVQIQVPQTSHEGLEAAARRLRYAALGRLCAGQGVVLLLTAHHQDDQLETLLLRLMRGAGVEGLSGMAPLCAPQSLLDGARTHLGRPLLELSRAALHDWARKHALTWIEDESNTDVRFARNRLRHAVLPELERLAPGWAHNLLRSAGHLRQTATLLDTYTQESLQHCRHATVAHALSLRAVRALPDVRRAALLRAWLTGRALPMPSSAHLHTLCRALQEMRAEQNLVWQHAGWEVRCFQDALQLQLCISAHMAIRQTHTFSWRGEARLDFPDWGGSLLFETAAHGVAADWLAAAPLQLGPRRGQERLQCEGNRPHRRLKQWYQMRTIPPWQRPALPLLHRGPQLLFAAGIGMDWACRQHTGTGIVLRWETMAPGASHMGPDSGQQESTT